MEQLGWERLLCPKLESVSFFRLEGAITQSSGHRCK